MYIYIYANMAHIILVCIFKSSWLLIRESYLTAHPLSRVGVARADIIRFQFPFNLCQIVVDICGVSLYLSADSVYLYILYRIENDNVDMSQPVKYNYERLTDLQSHCIILGMSLGCVHGNLTQMVYRCSEWRRCRHKSFRLVSVGFGVLFTFENSKLLPMNGLAREKQNKFSYCNVVHCCG